MMKHDEKRTIAEINRDIEKAVNKNIYSQYKYNILTSIFLTALLLISYLVISFSSFNSSWIVFILACLFMVMTIVLKKLYKKVHQQEQVSITEIQQESGDFYPESNKS
ncbi:hypothetical protein [Wohlfahrtiimonas chitiniclastica]|uniref:hypothetical protein n=1 Tax=Wohlfahrtiimonas chitiniclastica TaxID=400946 RepID=UPI000B990ED1|nr:hypothetical protein [Wohlfahrtiimonas chitiniclastica]OYQ75954.1 hypothetical protein B9T18_00945 [Wohlfahrtiimonas chitiniclastica]